MALSTVQKIKTWEQLEKAGVIDLPHHTLQWRTDTNGTHCVMLVTLDLTQRKTNPVIVLRATKAGDTYFEEIIVLDPTEEIVADRVLAVIRTTDGDLFKSSAHNRPGDSNEVFVRSRVYWWAHMAVLDAVTMAVYGKTSGVLPKAMDMTGH